MKIRITALGLPAGLLAASLFGACSNTARGIQEDTAQNTEKARDASADAAARSDQAAEDAKVKADEAADAAKRGMERAADATRDAAHDAAVATKGASADVEQRSSAAAGGAAAALDATQQTMEIKSALTGDSSVDASGIDVDTNGRTKTVTLKGHVPTAAQKVSAERIAKSKAPDYTVVNQLVVR